MYSGLSSILYLIIALKYRQPMLLLIFLTSFLSDYIYFGRSSPWHPIDRVVAKASCVFFVWNGYLIFSHTLFVVLFTLTFSPILGTYMAIRYKIPWLYEITHTTWHFTSSVSIMTILEHQDSFCYKIPYFRSTSGHFDLISAICIYSIFWFIIRIISDQIGQEIDVYLRPSSKGYEDATFIGQKVHAIIKAFVLAIMSNVSMISLLFESYSVQKDGFPGFPLIEVAGILFTSFEICDLLLGGFHNSITPTFVIHHLIYIFTCYTMLLDCSRPLLASALLAQETSSIFLNMMLVSRNRYPSFRLFHRLFASTFFIWRILLSTIVIVWYFTSSYVPGSSLLDLSLIIGVFLQSAWGYQIATMVARS